MLLTHIHKHVHTRTHTHIHIHAYTLQALQTLVGVESRKMPRRTVRQSPQRGEGISLGIYSKVPRADPQQCTALCADRRACHANGCPVAARVLCCQLRHKSAGAHRSVEMMRRSNVVQNGWWHTEDLKIYQVGCSCVVLGMHAWPCVHGLREGRVCVCVCVRARVVCVCVCVASGAFAAHTLV